MLIIGLCGVRKTYALLRMMWLAVHPGIVEQPVRAGFFHQPAAYESFPVYGRHAAALTAGLGTGRQQTIYVYTARGNSMGSPTGLDKRRFRRLDVELDVTVRIETDGKKTGLPESLQAACRNLSVHGLCLETSRLANNAVKLLSGRRGERDYSLCLEITLNPEAPPLQARGEVCWYNVDHSRLDFVYQIGVEFIELAPKSRATLKRFIRKHCQPRTPLQLIKSFFTRS